MKFQTSPAPHIGTNTGSDAIKSMFIASLLPVIFSSAYFFGFYALLIILVSTIGAVLTEIILQKLTKSKIRPRPGTIITGLLLGLILPSSVPLWIPFIGSAFAVSIGKYAFGVGNNIFNPALVGRAFLLAAWPAIMTKWAVDGVTSATPLAAAFEGSKSAVYSSLFFGSVSGSIGETSALAIIIAAIFLLYKKIIDWRTIASYIGGVLVLAMVLGQDPVFHILAGGVLFGAVFMATGYMSTPITKNGRLIFGFGCALLTMIIRIYAGAPEGVTFAILIMNALTPLIDRYTIPKPFGKK